MTVIGILIFLFIFLDYNSFSTFPGIPIFGAFFLTIGLPIQVYFTSKKNYKSNKRISETIIYEFDRERIKLKGESFDSNLSWDKIYDVTESKEWLLIWQNRQVANVVPKRDFKNTELQVFKAIVSEQQGLKSKLK